MTRWMAHALHGIGPTVLALLLVAARRPRPISPDTLALEAEAEVARRAMRSYREALEKFVKD